MCRVPAMATLFVAVVLALPFDVATAAVDDNEREAKVKAAYVLNFIRFSKWPAEAFEDRDGERSPIVIVVLGSDEAGIATLLDAMLDDRDVQGRNGLVRRLAYPDAVDPDEQSRLLEALGRELNAAHLLFIDASLDAQVPEILDGLTGATLTVGDSPKFAARGGMLGFVRVESRVVFEANPEAITQSGVALTSMVLQLARIVETKEFRE